MSDCTDRVHTTHYSLSKKAADDDDNKDKDVIPDILLKFPERNYIIDAKVSLADWTKYVEAVKSNKEEDKKDSIETEESSKTESKEEDDKDQNKDENLEKKSRS